MSAGRYDVLVGNLDQATAEVAAAVTRGDLATATGLCAKTGKLNVLLRRAHAAANLRRKEYDAVYGRGRRGVLTQRRGAAEAQAELAPLTEAAARALAALVSANVSVSAATSKQEAAQA